MTWLSRSAVALMAAAAVAIAGTPAATASASHHLRTFTLQDRGRHISLQNGHKIKLNLRTDSDGGYSWKFPKHDNFTIVRKTVYPYKHKKGQVGFPYHTVYILRATATGDGSVIRLVERGPSGHSDIGRRFRLTVDIH